MDALEFAVDGLIIDEYYRRHQYIGPYESQTGVRSSIEGLEVKIDHLEFFRDGLESGYRGDDIALNKEESRRCTESE
jgi:hypothetical protein